ncbi:MAG: adenylate kinase [Anaerolineaceae bacterium]|nr:adenylate kinase [Anaerolineaceae bacterium]
MAVYIVLLGPPGAGKGTQAEKISEVYHLTHVSTGDLFRQNIRENTELGKKAREYTDNGLLVPDEVTIAMVEDRLKKDDCKNGALLDGFPRTIKQAEALDEMLDKSFGAKVTVVPCIDVDQDALVSRISGRRMCKNGHVFHVVTKQPKVEGVCDVCGEPLYQRADDNEETVKTRLNAYNETTSKLVEFYGAKNIVRTIDGNKPIPEVSEAILAAINEAI